MNVVGRPLAPTRDFVSSSAFRIGSEAHKQAFCGMLLETFNPYKPVVIDWPDLAPDALARLTGLPIWTIAVETEDKAAAHISAMAKATPDPLLRQALELMAFEESRHRKVLDALVKRYGIVIDPKPYRLDTRTLWNFMTTGYGECLDSFFAFGLFELAKRLGFFPEELVETFEPVIQEEARHIVFFVNWAAYVQANTPWLKKPVFAAKRLAHLAINGIARMGIVPKDEDNFAAHGKESVGVDIELAAFMDMCLAENDRRMALLDPRLKRPMIMPRLIKAARFFIR